MKKFLMLGATFLLSYGSAFAMNGELPKKEFFDLSKKYALEWECPGMKVYCHQDQKRTLFFTDEFFGNKKEIIERGKELLCKSNFKVDIVCFSSNLNFDVIIRRAFGQMMGIVSEEDLSVITIHENFPNIGNLKSRDVERIAFLFEKIPSECETPEERAFFEKMRMAVNSPETGLNFFNTMRSDFGKNIFEKIPEINEIEDIFRKLCIAVNRLSEFTFFFPGDFASGAKGEIERDLKNQEANECADIIKCTYTILPVNFLVEQFNKKLSDEKKSSCFGRMEEVRQKLKSLLVTIPDEFQRYIASLKKVMDK